MMPDSTSAKISRNGYGFPSAEMRVRIEGYEVDRENDPAGIRALATVLDAVPELDLGAGERVEVAMGLHPLDANRLIADLMNGDGSTDTPACDVGSVVRFLHCEPVNDGEVEAGDYRVEEAVAPRAPGLR